MLRSMNRPWQGQVNDEIIENLKAALPGAVLRTTFIVGFPGETEAQFNHLKDFVERHKFDHVGVFTFSAEEGTAAYDLPNKIAQSVMDARREEIMLTQQEISFRRNQAQIGTTVQVLIEQENPSTGELIGRSARFAPDVDGLVYVKGSAPGQAAMGQMATVLIEAADSYDLFGSIATSDSNASESDVSESATKIF
jgi:ribosomal protein S12 methylthiotransferase